MFHTPGSFLKFGWKQPSTWIGIFLLCWFVYSFYGDIHTLIHNILIDTGLVEKIITGIGGVSLIAFNKFKDKDDDHKPDSQ